MVVRGWPPLNLCSSRRGWLVRLSPLSGRSTRWPATTDTDIASYALKAASSLPPGLTLDGTSGVVSGTLLRVVRPRSRVAFTPAAQIGIGPEGTEM